MTQYEVNALPVVDSREQFIGLVTREAVQKALFHKLSGQPIEHIMLQDIFLAHSDTPFEEVQQQMVERNQRIVPILDHHTVIGIFSRTDLLRALHQEKPQDTTPVTPPTKATPSTSTPLHTWNVTHLLKNRLSAPLLALLEKVEQLADQRDVSAFLVGGFVRDLLMDIPNFDLDFMIEGDGIQFGKALAKEFIRENGPSTNDSARSQSNCPNPLISRRCIISMWPQPGRNITNTHGPAYRGTQFHQKGSLSERLYHQRTGHPRQSHAW